jgi:hypothetical protein
MLNTNDTVETLVTLAAEIESLPNRGDSMAERAESGGRLLLDAMAVGAFGGPRRAAFRTTVKQRAEQTFCNGYISAWDEAAWMFRGKPEGFGCLGHRFVDDCAIFAKGIRAEAQSLRERLVTSPLPQESELSEPMSKAEFARRVFGQGKGEARARDVQPLLKKYGYEQTSAHHIRVRLDTMDPHTRSRVEKST